MNTTIKKLADIGARAALDQLQKHGHDWSLAVWSGAFHYNNHQNAREAFAQAIVEEVATEWSQIVVAEQAKKHESLSIIEQAIEMVNTPGTTAETLPKAINAKIMQRDEFHDATLKKLDAAKAEIARLIQLDATNRDNLERTHKALVNTQLAHTTAQREVKTLRTELAKRDERLAALEWRPVSVKPTREDADEGGKVIWTNGTSYLEIDWNNIDGMHPSWKWWRPFSPPPAPTPEEIERREWEQMIASCVPGGQSCDPQVVADNLRAWQAARAAKEGKV